MTNTEKRLELLEQLVKEVTDYGFNDEYGYYNDWADGVRPILEKAITQAIAEDRARMRGEIEKFGKECEELKANGICGHFNCGTGQVKLDDLLSSLDKLTDKE